MPVVIFEKRGTDLLSIMNDNFWEELSRQKASHFGGILLSLFHDEKSTWIMLSRPGQNSEQCKG